MPWEEQRVMSLKIDFVEQASRPGANVSELCREFGISRQTGHKLLRRFAKLGYAGLEEESRRPTSSPMASGEDVVVAILEARRRHPFWGARKLMPIVAGKLKGELPSERTFTRILERLGAIRKRRKRKPPNIVERGVVFAAKASNDVWTIDFKGWWLASNRERCEPLTVRDAYSRYVLAIELVSTRGASVRLVLERLFKRHGVPKAIQCDNGTPFISVRAPAGLSALSVWWTSLGIRTVRSRLASPQDNGAHERMHRDMATELESDPSVSRAAQQRACAKWRQQFNHVRAHDALRGKTPAEVYAPKRRNPRVQPPTYAKRMLVRRVNAQGAIHIGGAKTFISRALKGYTIGLEHTDGVRYRGWFYDINLGVFELQLPNRVLSRCADRVGIRAA